MSQRRRLTESLFRSEPDPRAVCFFDIARMPAFDPLRTLSAPAEVVPPHGFTLKVKSPSVA
jgi:hypothetical protein